MRPSVEVAVLFLASCGTVVSAADADDSRGEDRVVEDAEVEDEAAEDQEVDAGDGRDDTGDGGPDVWPEASCDPSPGDPGRMPCPDGGVEPIFSVVRALTPVDLGDPAPCGPGCRQLTPVGGGYPVPATFDVWGDVVVLNPGNRSASLLIARLDTGQLFELATPEFPGSGELNGPAVSVADGIVYWTSYEHAGEVPDVEHARLWSYDLATSAKRVLLEWDSRVSPDREGERFLRLLDAHTATVAGVWARLTGSDVCMVDLCAPEFRPVGPFNCCTGSYLTPPRLWGSVLGISGDPSGTSDVFVYDDRTGTTLSVPGDGARSEPALHRSLLVWTDSRNGTGEINALGPNNLDIYGMDLESGAQFPVTTNPANQEFPDVYGCRVTYRDTRDDPGDPSTISSDSVIHIYMTDLRTGEETLVTGDLDVEGFARIWGDWIVFSDYDSDRGGNALFAIDLTAR